MASTLRITKSGATILLDNQAAIRAIKNCPAKVLTTPRQALPHKHGAPQGKVQNLTSTSRDASVNEKADGKAKGAAEDEGILSPHQLCL
ncbi:hypothetical protein NLI96_g4601 [Meripilus lineatus]|uniref:Uncharacterized protein n=1 Tax=Meripilus lineatus TaxID=2056292 RepID=A0AAD5V4K1_9APHY|nr:hypothetical protein NLI96_g4601 [Physisporinus lineatus]